LDTEEILNKLKNHRPVLYNKDLIRKYSVFLPLVEKDGETHLLFEVRSMTLRSQPGDVCFPGGGMEEVDSDEKQAALRETREELGVSEAAIYDVYPLDYMMMSPELMIYPFVGRLRSNIKLSPNKAEVEETFTIPLKYFLETDPLKYNLSLEAVPEQDFPFHLIVGGEDYDFRHRTVDQYFYKYGDYVIWGLTANIILNFISFIKKNEE